MNMKFALIRAETLKLNRHADLRAALTLFALALGFMLSNPALGADGKEYPGTMCEEAYFVTPGKSEGNIVFSVDGDALNIANHLVLITCPLTRDAERHQGKILYAAVSVYKPGSTAVVCGLESRPYFGGSGWFQSGVSDPFKPTGLQLIEFPGEADSYTSGNYNISCWLPPAEAGKKSGIAHYGIVEAE